MKKKIILLLYFGLLLTFSVLFLQTNINASENNTLYVHYHRFNNDYNTGGENYVAHLWETNLDGNGEQIDSKAGTDHNFQTTPSDEWGVYTTYELSFERDYIGIIVRHGNGWDKKDWNDDRFIKISDIEVQSDGSRHIWVAQWIGEIAINSWMFNSNIPNITPVTNAYVSEDLNSLDVYTYINPLSYELYEYGNTSAVKTSTLNETDTNNRFFSVEYPFDINKSYSITVNYSDDRSYTKAVSYELLYDEEVFINTYTYTGDLGVILDKTENTTTFRLWAPISTKVELILYNDGNYFDEVSIPEEVVPMERIENGVFEVVKNTNLSGKYYTFKVYNGDDVNEVTDPYAYSTGVNGMRGLVVDFDSLNPEGWQYNSRPNNVTNWADYIIYELHVRDLTTHDSWNGTEANRGKYLGLAETGTTYTNEETNVTVSTGFDHIKELGVNAVQLVPVFDYVIIDETKLEINEFNWGYMPQNYNTLEGSYSADPYDGEVRVNEFKQVVQAYHDADIRIIMDVVYNHTGHSESSNYHQIIPGYYHRMYYPEDNFGRKTYFHNASGTGNETASERSMFRKYMVDSVLFWANEYNISGFRFDLMAIHDVETMNLIVDELALVDPTIVVFGEPWAAGEVNYDGPIANNWHSANGDLKAGLFNDRMRDAAKGGNFNPTDQGWVQGNTNDAFYDYNYKIRNAAVGGVLDAKFTDDKNFELPENPNYLVNYVSAHDNSTLHDKLIMTGLTGERLLQAQIQANALVLTSQGVAFLHAGSEMLRSKPAAPTDRPGVIYEVDGKKYNHNSYESPDSVNQLRWDLKANDDNLSVFNYYKALISIRKTFDHFRLSEKELIRESVNMVYSTPENPSNYDQNQVAYKIDHNDLSIWVIHTSNTTNSIDLGDKYYSVLTDKLESNLEGLNIVTGTITPEKYTSMILVEFNESYKVTFDSDGGSTVDSQEVSYNKKVNKPVGPTKVGFIFLGWFLDNEEFDFDTIITTDVTLTAQWEEITHTVEFDSDGGSLVDDQTVREGLKANKPANPTKEGFQFIGWYIGDNEFDFDTVITTNIALTAKWKVTTYNVEFDSDGGSSIDSQEVNYNERANKPIDPTKEEYEFTGWFLDGRLFSFNDNVTENITLVARWKKVIVDPETKTFTVTFNSDGGSLVESEEILDGEKSINPDEPNRDGYTFIGWFLDDEQFDFNTIITSNITLTAKWEEITHTVEFDSDGGSLVDDQTVREGLKANKPANPTKEGFQFIGWYIGDDEFDFETAIDKDITLTAKWDKDEEPIVPVVEFTVTFNSDGGNAIDSQTVEAGSKVIKPTDPTKNGFKFLGWFLADKDFDFDSTIEDDITLVAQWEENELVGHEPEAKIHQPLLIILTVVGIVVIAGGVGIVIFLKKRPN